MLFHEFLVKGMAVIDYFLVGSKHLGSSLFKMGCLRWIREGAQSSKFFEVKVGEL